MTEYPTTLPMRTEAWAQGSHEARPCPICKQPWSPWPGSFLPCHSRCLFTADVRRALVKDPRIDRNLAAAVGVTVSVIRAARGRR